jgi:hypothetical protein
MSLRLACWLSADARDNAKVLLRQHRAGGRFMSRLSRHAALAQQHPIGDLPQSGTVARDRRDKTGGNSRCKCDHAVA